LAPSTHPFEDPFITTDLRAWGVWNDLPSDSIFGGGNVFAVSLQARIAITDRLAFIATKDGYAHIDPANTAVFKNSGGALNIAAGFKYAVIDMREDNFDPNAERQDRAPRRGGPGLPGLRRRRHHPGHLDRVRDR